MKKIVFIMFLCTWFITSNVYAQKYELNTQAHVKYMDGCGDGSFNPDGYVKRSEAAQIIYNLMTKKPQVTIKFSDIADDMWYSQAVNSLYSEGLISGKYSDDTFYPEELISRAEMVDIICRFYPENAG